MSLIGFRSQRSKISLTITGITTGLISGSYSIQPDTNNIEDEFSGVILKNDGYEIIFVFNPEIKNSTDLIPVVKGIYNTQKKTSILHL